MKSLKELRMARSKFNKHVVILRLDNTEEEKLVRLLEDSRDTLTAYVHKLVRNSLKPTRE